MSHFILQQPLVRARHALPHSHGRPLERRPRAGGRPTRAAELGGCGRRARGSDLPAGERPRLRHAASESRLGSPERPALASREACGITSPGSELLGAGRQRQARRVARPRGWRGVPVGSAPRASLFPAARRRRGRREGQRLGAPRLGGGSWPHSRACAASHPRAPRAPSACPDPPLPPPLPPTSPTGPRLT